MPEPSCDDSAEIPLFQADTSCPMLPAIDPLVPSCLPRRLAFGCPCSLASSAPARAGLLSCLPGAGLVALLVLIMSLGPSPAGFLLCLSRLGRSLMACVSVLGFYVCLPPPRPQACLRACWCWSWPDSWECSCLLPPSPGRSFIHARGTPAVLPVKDSPHNPSTVDSETSRCVHDASSLFVG